MDDSTFDDSLPLPNEVEKELSAHAGHDVDAWLSEHGIDAEPIGRVIQYGMVWNPNTGRYQFLIYGPDHVGPKYPPELAIPIFEDGKFVDLLVISESMSFARVTCRVSWLGTITPTTRLHAHPLDWLQSGCTGACHVEPISRKALKELRAAKTIECNCIHTALEAWGWGFGGEDDELARFEIDDSPESIRSYFEDEVRWRVLHRLRTEGLPIGVDAKSDLEFTAYIEKMRSEYVYAGDALETESQS